VCVCWPIHLRPDIHQHQLLETRHHPTPISTANFPFVASNSHHAEIYRLHIPDPRSLGLTPKTDDTVRADTILRFFGKEPLKRSGFKGLGLETDSGLSTQTTNTFAGPESAIQRAEPVLNRNNPKFKIATPIRFPHHGSTAPVRNAQSTCQASTTFQSPPRRLRHSPGRE
jgi:hypothetical protein